MEKLRRALPPSGNRLNRERGEQFTGLGRDYKLIDPRKLHGTELWAKLNRRAVVSFRKAAERRGVAPPIHFGDNDVLVQLYPAKNTIVIAFEAMVAGKWLIYAGSADLDGFPGRKEHLQDRGLL